MKDSKIEWTDHTFSPWWGCAKVSPGCAHCYAETFDRRVHGTSKHVTASGETREPHWGKDAPRRFFGDKHWAEPLRWDWEAAVAMNAAERGQAGGASGALPHRPRVFCASMADVFEDRPDLVEPRARLFRLIDATPNLDWLLLTKRPENVARMAPEMHEEVGDKRRRLPANVWLGTTAEDQQRADERIPHLVAVPASVRFLSVEPMLGPVDLCLGEYPAGIRPDWVIVGGESGAGARPFDIEWARSIVRQTREAGVACFVKQLGAKPHGAHDPDCERCGGKGTVIVGGQYPEPDGCPECYPLFPLEDAKGGEPREWPEGLRVRQFPKGGAA